jgi:hypothetical protein
MIEGERQGLRCFSAVAICPELMWTHAGPGSVASRPEECGTSLLLTPQLLNASSILLQLSTSVLV